MSTWRGLDDAQVARNPELAIGQMVGRGEGHPGFSTFLGAEGLLKNIHGVAKGTERDGDEIGYLVCKVAEVKRQPKWEKALCDLFDDIPGQAQFSTIPAKRHR